MRHLNLLYPYICLVIQLKKDKDKISIKDYNDMSTDCIVDFEIVFAPGIIDELLNNKLDDHTNELEKVLKLYTTQSTTNIHAFDSQERLKKYNKVESMIDDYYITDDSGQKRYYES